MTNNVQTGTLNATHSLTHSLIQMGLKDKMCESFYSVVHYHSLFASRMPISAAFLLSCGTCLLMYLNVDDDDIVCLS